LGKQTKKNIIAFFSIFAFLKKIISFKEKNYLFFVLFFALFFVLFHQHFKRRVERTLWIVIFLSNVKTDHLRRWRGLLLE
jgi:positive regulator of sigma E activity